jgi:hypothetical protein
MGLHSAMHVIPVLGALLALVLFAAARSVPGDTERLRRWMRESTAEAGDTAREGERRGGD